MLPRPCHAGAALAAALSASGCRCDSEQPYTPFHIGPSPSASAAGAPSPSASNAPAPSFESEEAAAAPKDASEWVVDEVALAVDKSRVLDRAITADFDGDGATDAVAWTRPREAAPDTHVGGELLVFSSRNAGAGRVLGTIPPFVPAGPGCRQTVRLARTGPRTVTLDVSARCEAALVPRSPTRGIAVFAPFGERPIVLALRLADAAPGETTRIAVDSRDRDGDGRDDVRLTVALETTADDHEAALDLVWLDRTAGPSRDATEPAQSLGSLASTELVRAPGKTTGRRVPGRVANARRLYANLCAEGGTPRFFDSDGAPLPCGNLGAGLGQLAAAEVRAFVAQKDALAATSALDRAAWHGPALSTRVRAAAEKDVLSLAPARLAVEKPVSATPRARSGLPRWSPLTFEPSGALLLQTVDGVKRAAAPDFQAITDDAGVAPWPLLLSQGAAPSWMGVAFPCDRAEVLLLESDPTGTPLPSKPTAILAPRPGLCAGGGKVPTPALVPVAWGPTETVGFVGTALFGAKSVGELPGAPVPGSPRSPDGRSLVLPWSGGLFVGTGGTFSTWLANDPLALSDCVIGNGGGRVACVRGEQAVVLTTAEGKVSSAP